MKKIKVFFILPILVCLLFLGIGKTGDIFADDFKEFQVKIIFETKLYEKAEISEVVFDGIELGEELTVTGEEELDASSGFNFYPVSYNKDGNNYTGYIIKNFVIKIENLPLKKSLDPNAKTIKEAQVYNDKSEENKLQIEGENIILKQYQEIKIIDYTDSDYKKIMFEIDGEIYTGFVKSTDVIVEGFNATIILIVFIFALAGSIALSIFLTTRKKRKKKAQNG